MQNIYTISNNLSNIAKELEDAQGKSDKLSKKGNKANSQKVDMASSKLESAQQQWDSQAPFVFESLQALDESRVNQLRDLLTQYQTHETDLAERLQIVSAETLAVMLDISTEAEVQNFVSSVLADRPVPITRSSTRRSSVTTPQPSNPPPLPLGATDLSTRSETPSTPAKEDPPAPIAADSTIDGLPPSQDAKPGMSSCKKKRKKKEKHREKMREIMSTNVYCLPLIRIKTTPIWYIVCRTKTTKRTRRIRPTLPTKS